MQDDFISLVKTLDDRERFRTELDKIASALGAPGGTEKALGGISFDLAGYLKGKVISAKHIEVLGKALSDLEVVGLTLAFAPKTSQVTEIYNWLGANIGHTIVIDFAVDDSLGAGAVIEFKGKYLDDSLSGKMN